jgi:hypothetical protein
LEATELLKLAQSVVDEFEAPDLSDLLSELTTHADRRLSTFTRREILKATDFLGSLFGEHPQSLYECLEVIAPRWTTYAIPPYHFAPSRMK